MELEALQSELKQFEDRLLNTVRQEVAIKVKEEVKAQIIETIITKMDENTNKITTKMDENTNRIIQAIGVGDLQTHELLSNIAGVMTNMDNTLKNLDKKMDGNSKKSPSGS